VNQSRRHLLQQLPLFVLANSLRGASFPTKARDRLAVTSWPFRTLIESPTNRQRDATVPGIDLKEFPALIVEKFDVHNINPLSAHFHSSDPAYLDSFREAVQKADSHIVDLGLSGGQFYAADAAARAKAVDYGRKWIDVAVAIGSPSVRQHVSGPRGETPNVERAAASLGEMAEYGAKRNVVVNLENDNAVAEDPFFLVSVIEKVNSRHLRALPDFGNSLPPHDADYNEKAVKAMLKYAYNMCHVKDTLRSANGETHVVDLEKMFELAKASGYKGYFSMEFDTKSGDPFSGTKKLIEETLKYLA
jgi:sugar phosphate isomerase/epimerase